jgi:hypothetical protein
MSMSTKFCIGTVPGLETLRWYSMAPPTSVPAEVETAPPSLDGFLRGELCDRGDVDRTGGRAECVVGQAVVVEIEGVGRRTAAAALGQPWIIGGEIEGVAQRSERGAHADGGRDENPDLLVDAEIAAAGVPRPAQQRPPRAREVRYLREGLRRREAGALIVEGPGDEDEIDREEVGGREELERRRVAGTGIAAHAQTVGDGLSRVERAAAGEVVFGRVELHERAAQREGVADVLRDVGGAGRVDGGEVGAVLNGVAECDRIPGVIGIRDLPGDERLGRGSHSDLGLPVLPLDAGEVFACAEAGWRRAERRVRGGIGRASP